MTQGPGVGLDPIASLIVPEYLRPMINKYHLSKFKRLGFVSTLVLLVTFTKSVGSAQAQTAGATVTPPIVVAPVVIQDNFIYYPNYGVYYNSRRHQYHYLKDNVWVSQPVPTGVSVSVLQASPSVNMDFHDAPEKHHAEMLKKYPHDWKPSAVHQEQKQDHKDAAPDRDKK